jgi:hypothetical protein
MKNTALALIGIFGTFLVGKEVIKLANIGANLALKTSVSFRILAQKLAVEITVKVKAENPTPNSVQIIKPTITLTADKAGKSVLDSSPPENTIINIAGLSSNDVATYVFMLSFADLVLKSVELKDSLLQTNNLGVWVQAKCYALINERDVLVPISAQRGGQEIPPLLMKAIKNLL